MASFYGIALKKTRDMMYVMRSNNGGYAGLVVLMVSVAIIALVFVKVYLTPQKQSEDMRIAQPLSASGTAPTTEIGRMHADVDAANSMRDKLNAQNQATNAELLQ